MQNFVQKALLTAGLTAVLTGGTMAQDLELSIGANTYTISLYDSKEAQLLLDKLPVTLTFENFGRNERIADLPSRLPITSYKESVEVKRGSLAYYVPWGNLCVFRVNYQSPNDLVLLGEMDEATVKAVEQCGSQQATLRIKE